MYNSSSNDKSLNNITLLILIACIIILLYNKIKFTNLFNVGFDMSGGDEIKKITYYCVVDNLNDADDYSVSADDNKIANEIEFADEVENILNRSRWGDKYNIIRVDDPDKAIVKIHLSGRSSLDKFHDNPEYYSNGKQIRFSITTQSKFSKPEIFIDADNWHYGVDESGLSVNLYREYVINHEFGHALGYDHAECVKKLCPVMYQMTRGVPEGHTPNYQVKAEDYKNRIINRYIK